MFLKAAVLGLAILAATPALAATFVPASPPGSMVLDLDTDQGHYSVWRLPVADSVDAIRATLKVHRLGADPRWDPSFSITFRNGDDKIVFRIVSPARQPPLILRTETYKAGAKTEDESFYATLALDQAVDLKIEWTAAGEVAIQAGGEKHTVMLGGPVKTVEFAASTGEAEFNPLEIGHMAP